MPVGRSFSEHRDVDLPGPQGIAYRTDEQPRAADLGEVATVDVAAGGHADEGPRHTAGGQSGPDQLDLGRASGDVHGRPGERGLTTPTTFGPPGQHGGHRLRVEGEQPRSAAA